MSALIGPLVIFRLMCFTLLDPSRDAAGFLTCHCVSFPGFLLRASAFDFVFCDFSCWFFSPLGLLASARVMQYGNCWLLLVYLWFHWCEMYASFAEGMSMSSRRWVSLCIWIFTIVIVLRYGRKRKWIFTHNKWKCESGWNFILIANFWWNLNNRVVSIPKLLPKNLFYPMKCLVDL